MQMKNTKDDYGTIAVFFHWIIAILVIGMLCLGLYMTGLPKGLERLKLYGWHKEIGITILIIVIARLVWRLFNLTPNLINLPLWEQVAARTVHWLLYFFMLAMPITGWLMTSAAGLQVSFYGLFLVPALIPPNKELMHLFASFHEFFAYGFIVIICLHIAAALKHEFINRDDILRRMLP